MSIISLFHCSFYSLKSNVYFLLAFKYTTTFWILGLNMQVLCDFLAEIGLTILKFYIMMSKSLAFVCAHIHSFITFELGWKIKMGTLVCKL